MSATTGNDCRKPGAQTPRVGDEAGERRADHEGGEGAERQRRDIHRGGPVATGSGGGGRQRINQRHAEAECGEAGNDHREAVAEDDQHDADHRDQAAEARRAHRPEPHRRPVAEEAAARHEKREGRISEAGCSR